MARFWSVISNSLPADISAKIAAAAQTIANSQGVTLAGKMHLYFGRGQG
jgi:hypothetical protein